MDKISPKQHLGRKAKNIEQYAARFKLVGGPHHNQMVRLYAPWDELKFSDGNVYELHGPLDKTDQWVYTWTRKEDDGPTAVGS